MKKYFFFLCSAIAALLMTSCSEEDIFNGQAGDVVTFNVSIPELATRAAGGYEQKTGDGFYATSLYYGIYEKNGDSYELKSDISAIVESKAIEGEGGKFNVQVRLVKQKPYRIVFWAENMGNKMCTIDWENQTLKLNSSLSANQEAYDAFWAYKDVTIQGATAETVSLTRPFAQLNIGVSNEDWDAAVAAGIEIENSKVVVENVPTTMNIINGTVDAEKEVTYQAAALPKTYNNIDEFAFPVGDNKYLALNYVLVGEEKSLINIELEYKDEYATQSYSTSFTSVPVQRNWRTNIYGNILTSDADYNVEIKPGFTGDVNSEAEVALRLAAQAGGKFTLEEDLTLASPLMVTADFELDLNGKTISGDWHKDNGAIIKNSANLKLIGGTVKSTANNGGSALQNNGTAILEGTTLNGAPNADGSWPSYTVNNTGKLTLNNSTITSYHGAIASYGDNAVVTLNDCVIDMTGIPGFTSHGIYTYNNGKVIVNGGTYENKATDQTASGASVINGYVEVNAGTFNGRIENYFGTPVLKGGTYSAQPKANYIANGYKAIEKYGKWYVVPAEVTEVAGSEAEIRTALQQKNAIVYVYPTEDGSSYKLEGKLSLAEGVKLIGAGDEPVALFNDWGSNAFANQAHFTNTHIENVYFSNNLIIDAGIANGNVTFKGCVFGGDLAHQGVHFDSGNGTITFDDCTFVGRNMFGSSLENVIFNNCKFENKKSSQIGADKWTGVNMWGKYEFNNCEFDTEATCNVKCDGVIADFNNCFYSNSQDIKKVISNSPEYTCTITVDGVVVAGLSSVLANAPEGSTIVLAEDVNLGEVTVGELKNVTILGSENTSMRFVTNADSKIKM